jgi:hypothetical protein
MFSRLSNLSKRVRSIFRPDKQQDNKNATLIYSSIIVLKILERLGKCKTQNDLDDLLSLLGNSFTGMFEKFIRDIGDEKSTSLEDIINTFRTQSDIADIGKYLKTLEADICETFEAHFELDATSKTPYDDVFEHDKWELDGMFEYMVNKTFGPMSFYFVILTIFNVVHVSVSVAHRAIIYELADIAWFIRDKDNSVLRSLCLSNPMYINHKTNRGCIGKMVVDRWGDYDDDFLLKLMQGGDNLLFFQIFDMVDADERRIQRLIALNVLFNKIRESKTINMEAKMPNFIQKMRPFFFNYSNSLRQLRPLIRVLTVQKKQPHLFEQEHAPDKSHDLHEILHEFSSIFKDGHVWTRKVAECIVCLDGVNQYLFGNPSPVECKMSLLLGPQCTTCVDVKNNLCHSCASELRVCPTCRKSLVDVITVEVCPTLPSLPSVKRNPRKRTAASSAEEGNPRTKRSSLSLMNAMRKWLNLAETDEERDLLKLLKKIQNKLNPGQQHIHFRIIECIDQLDIIKQYTPKFILDEIEKAKQPNMVNEIEMVNEIITEMEKAIRLMRAQAEIDKDVQAIDNAYDGGRRRKTRTLKSHHRPNKTNKRNKTNKIKSRRRRN